MTTKIIDSTVIIASLKEISSIDLIAKCSERYSLATSIEVYDETKEAFNYDRNCYKKIRIFDMNENKLFIVLMEYLSDKYPYIHKGELSSFLVALIEYELKNKEYFFVTDDKMMRKTIPKIISQDELFIDRLSQKPAKFNITGTLGLLKRLYYRKILTKTDIEKVVEDLKNSTFYITPELIKYLKDC